MRLFKYLLLTLLIFFLVLIIHAFIRSGPGHVASGADCPVGLVPDRATNVDYYLPAPTWPNTYASFDIDEAGFREWVRTWQRRISGMDEIKKESGEIQIFDGSHRDKKIKNGLFVSYMSEPDSGIHLTYDLDQGRAYFYSHTR